MENKTEALKDSPRFSYATLLSLLQEYSLVPQGDK